MYHQFTYADALAASDRVDWRVEDLIGGQRRLDFGKTFMPESLARTEPLTFLSPRERMILNQIRGHGYLYMFGLVEEFILPFVIDHTRNSLDGDDHRTRAMLQFAAEEAKHIHLFKRFREAFVDGFGTECDVIGPASDISRAVLAHDPLAVALVILHIEWMTQRHYVDSVKDARDLDPRFKSLLKHHWMEEAQHAKLDTLMVDSLAAAMTSDEIRSAVEQYLEIGGFLDGGLGQQVAFDLDAFCTATGRRFSSDERETFSAVQHQAQRWTFIGSGMTHRNFLASLADLGAGAKETVTRIAPAFC